MMTLTQTEKDISIDMKEIEALRNTISKIEEDLSSLRWTLENRERDLSQKSIYLVNVSEIHRLAKYQFSRLREKNQAELLPEDIAELDKWIGRAKSAEGLETIKQAIQELDKYSPSEIKSNLYALVQKIIIGGAFNQNKK